LDREQALIGAVSASGSGVSKGIGSEGVELAIEEKVSCPSCGGPIKPYSRYCEICGGSVDPGTAKPERSSQPEESYEEDLPEEIPSPGVSPKTDKAVGRRWSRRTKDAVGDAVGENERGPTLLSANRKDREGGMGSGRRVDESPQQRTPIWWGVGLLVTGLVLLGLFGWWYWQGTETTGGEVEEGVGRPIPEGMVLVPGGTFDMGREGGDEFERPVHQVTVASFLLDRTEVTNLQYREYVVATGSLSPPHWLNGTYRAGEEQFPVVNITWEEAREYAKWAGKRLPSEVEWEYAARGKDRRLYPWGDEWDSDRANTERGANGLPMAVGSFPDGASPFGLLDMCGNVWEWTADDLTSYDNPTASLGMGKVIRGGAYDVPRTRALTTYRGVVPPANRYDKTGFRCAGDLSPTP
jgi:formylglycine-generating enzyme required for sulfatase activity